MHPAHDQVARTEIQRVAEHVEDLVRDVRIQFTRIAQIQADLDELKRRLNRPPRARRRRA